MKWTKNLPHPFILSVLCLTLGLAPFVPIPHVWEKLMMLFQGELYRPMDIFDLLMHGTPWILLFLKLINIKQTHTEGNEL